MTGLSERVTAKEKAWRNYRFRIAQPTQGDRYYKAKNDCMTRLGWGTEYLPPFPGYGVDRVATQCDDEAKRKVGM